MKQNQYKVVSLDLDGTLLPETSVSLWLAEKTGHAPLLAELEDRFRRGEIPNSVIADASANWLRGMREQDVWSWLSEARWIDGIQPVIDALRHRGIKVLLGTITWKVAAEFLKARHGFDAVCGTEMEIRDGILSGRVSRYFDEHDKQRFVAAYCHGLGISRQECVAVGDSRSDIPLFKEVGLAIALNATQAARQAAHLEIDGSDLQLILPAVLGAPGHVLGREN
jgi:phosphoserine phosphatase